MSTPEYNRMVPKLSGEALKNIAIEAEKWPKDKNLTPAGDQARRIWKAIKAFPAYSEKKGYDLQAIFDDVKEKIAELAEAKKAKAPLDLRDPEVIASLMPDAIANEMRQPRHTYNAEAEEEERKEMPNE